MFSGLSTQPPIWLAHCWRGTEAGPEMATARVPLKALPHSVTLQSGVWSNSRADPSKTHPDGNSGWGRTWPVGSGTTDSSKLGFGTWARAGPDETSSNIVAMQTSRRMAQWFDATSDVPASGTDGAG